MGTRPSGRDERSHNFLSVQWNGFNGPAPPGFTRTAFRGSLSNVLELLVQQVACALAVSREDHNRLSSASVSGSTSEDVKIVAQLR